MSKEYATRNDLVTVNLIRLPNTFQTAAACTVPLKTHGSRPFSARLWVWDRFVCCQTRVWWW